MSKTPEQLLQQTGIRVGPEWDGESHDDPLNFNVVDTGIALIRAGHTQLGRALMLAGLADARDIVREHLQLVRQFKVEKSNAD